MPATPSPSPGTAQLHGWINRIQAGDESARDELVRAFSARLEQLARLKLRDFPGVARWEQTGDVMNAAVLRLQRALSAVTPESPRHFYNLAGIQVRRELLDLARRYAGPQGLGANHQTDPSGGLLRQAADEGEPSSAAEWNEFLERAERLPEEEREAFDLLWVQGLTQEEAAAVLGVSVRTVKRRWQSARLLLSGLCC